MISYIAFFSAIFQEDFWRQCGLYFPCLCSASSTATTGWSSCPLTTRSPLKPTTMWSSEAQERTVHKSRLTSSLGTNLKKHFAEKSFANNFFSSSSNFPERVLAALNEVRKTKDAHFSFQSKPGFSSLPQRVTR